MDSQPKGDLFSDTLWDCKYHIVWIPKYRKKKLYRELRVYLNKVYPEPGKAEPRWRPLKKKGPAATTSPGTRGGPGRLFPGAPFSIEIREIINPPIPLNVSMSAFPMY
jgi:hypothetical protein